MMNSRPYLRLFAWILPFLLINLSHQQDCSASNLCSIGCCSSSGWCGTGPDFCGADACVANCNFKSDCNPGWGMEWSQNEKCPLNVCCSKFGFCGTTDEFCGDKKVDRPSCSSSKGIKKVIGYYESWSMTERACNGLLPEEIPYGVYTHINFAFATIDPTTFEVKATSTGAQDLMQRIGNLKLLQPDLKIWIAIGGWSFSDSDQSTAKTFSILSASKPRQQVFAKSLISMMSTYGFDGVDVDWEYPVAPDRNGNTYDYLSFTAWMESLKASLGGKGLSVTLPSSYWYMQHFDISHLEKHVDWFNIMLYDLHGAWDLTGKWTGPYINSHTNMTEINQALDLLWRNDIDPDKVVYGMAFYGRSFTLTNPSCSSPGCTFASGGNAGECSGTVGVLLNPEIKDIISKNSLKPKLYEKEAMKAINWGSQWVSFDDADTWKLKGDSLKSQCITNVMVWAISHDDKNATNAKALLKGLDKEIVGGSKIEPQPATVKPPQVIELCRWTNCGEQCPSGFKNVMRDGTSETMVDNSKCLGVGTSRQWCCPATSNLPTCTWRGHRNNGICRPGCLEGEVEVGTINVACNFNHQSACCTSNAATLAYGKCKWVGDYPTCSKKGGHADCPSDYPNFVVAASTGFGGEDACETGAKSYCCADSGPPAAFTNCEWYKQASGSTSSTDKNCIVACPKDTVRISYQKLGGCPGGTFDSGAYCCKGQPAKTLEPRDPSTGNNQYNDFVSLLKAYMKDPTCPNDSKHYDYFHDPVAKRSLTARQQCSTNGNFVRLVNWMAVLVTNAAIALDSPALIYAWNTIVAGEIDDGLLFLSLLRQRELTNWDPVAMMNDVLVDAQVAGEGLRNYQAAAPYVCEMYGARKRDDGALDLLESYNSQSEEVDRRHVEPFYRNTGNNAIIPNAATILAGIVNNHLTLNYVRWQWYQNREPFLEVAYWIGPNYGVTPTATEETTLNLQQYRDPRGNQPDRWVMMHFHFDITNRNLFMQDRTTGDVFIGSNSVRLYHGQRSTMRGRGRRVDNQDNVQNSRSALITCPPGQTFYIGHGAPTDHQPVPGGPTRPLGTFQQELQNFGRSLWDQGVVNTEGLDWVFQGQRLVGTNGQPGQYDLTHGQPTVRSRVNYGQSYQDSFRPNGAGGYDMNPNIPP